MMRRYAGRSGLLAALIVSVLLNWVARAPRTRPALEFVPNMVRTARYNSFEVNPNFADQATLRPPVPGTIPRGILPLHYTPSRIDARRAGEELVNPFSVSDPAALERGATIYRAVCQPCHGPEGRGDGAVVDHGVPKPPTLLRQLTRELKDGQIFHIITYGQRLMAAYAAQLSREDRWRVILYLRVLQQRAETVTPPAPTSTP